jgi:hypothetical protein
MMLLLKIKLEHEASEWIEMFCSLWGYKEARKGERERERARARGRQQNAGKPIKYQAI